MKFELDQKRKNLIAEPGHILVLGGPGSGKTTLAILKAKARIAALLPGQNVLFLSFSRAAVQQIIQRCRDILSADELRRIEVRTYHAFCWELLRAHGQALCGFPLTMMAPGTESVMRTQFTGDWGNERRRLLDEDGLVSFDAFAHAAARLLEESKVLRSDIGDIYPFVILDEFQDTDDDQWRLVDALAASTNCAFLADPLQRIYTFRPGVSAERLNILRCKIPLTEGDLQNDNHRSKTSDVLRFGDAVARAVLPSPACRDVSIHHYRPYRNIFNSTVLFHVRQMFKDLRELGIKHPAVAVLTPSNELVADISDALSTTRNFAKRSMPPVPHDIAWDAELSACAALCVASLLEQRSAFMDSVRKAALTQMAEFWLQKKDSCEQHDRDGAISSGKRATALQLAAAIVGTAKRIRSGSALLVSNCADALSGDPVADWAACRSVLGTHKDLQEIASQSRMVGVATSTDPIALALGNLWAASGSYNGARRIVSDILDRQRLIGADKPPRGCILMTLHKSKGKEFDGVVIVEGFRGGELLRPRERPDFADSRRVLRVGVTRARHRVRILRPQGAASLFGAHS